MFANMFGAHKFGVHNPRYLQAGPGYKPPKKDILDWLLANMKGRFELECFSSGCDIFFLTQADALLYEKTWFEPSPALLAYRGLNKRKDTRSRNAREGRYLNRIFNAV